MKCIKNVETGVITRVADEVASKYVDNKTHIYIPKSEWKKNVRDVNR